MSESITEMARIKIALLIDGDNAQPSLLTKMLTETGKYGAITIRRIYGDWTTSNMNGWKDNLNNHAIQPIQQFRYTVGKNATDSAMIIDAMDILHSGQVEGFCIASSDSDYTRLATRIRESGIFVMGIGKKQTPKSFVNACNVFIYTENLQPRRKVMPVKKNIVTKKKETADKKSVRVSEEDHAKLEELLMDAYDMAVQEDGWAHLSTIGSRLYQLDPGFDPRTYGYGQLSQLIKAQDDLFEIRFEKDKDRTAVYVRIIEAED